MLKKNRTLKYLNLSGNNLGNKGLNLLYNALKINRSLIKLNISNMSFSNRGVGWIIKIIKDNNILQYLDIYDNYIYDWSNSTTIKLLDALIHNYTLLCFRCSASKFRDYYSDTVDILSRNLRLYPLMVQAATAIKKNGKENDAKSILPKIVYEDCFIDLCH